jgi:hypothetical protein
MKLKHVLIGAIALAIAILGGLWLLLRQVPPSSSLDSFQQACIKGQRKGISGDTLPLDDATEARLLSFCDCVAKEVGSRLSQHDIAAVGLEQSSPAVDAQLKAIFALCRLQNP